MRELKITILIAILFGMNSCCKKDCANTYIIEGTVINVVDGTPSSGFEVELKEKVMENGVLNGFFQTAGTTTTDINGSFYLEFPRKSALEYELNISSEGWFPLQIEINPDDFAPEVPMSFELQTTPIAHLEISIINAPPSTDSDKMRVRLLKSFDEFSNCHTEWTVVNGANVDTTLTCIMPGGIWMPYLTIDQSDDKDVAITDSVFCSSFENTIINVIY